MYFLYSLILLLMEFSIPLVSMVLDFLVLELFLPNWKFF